MNFLKKKVQKAFESLVGDDDDSPNAESHGGSFNSSSSGGAEVIICSFIHSLIRLIALYYYQIAIMVLLQNALLVHVLQYLNVLF